MHPRLGGGGDGVLAGCACPVRSVLVDQAPGCHADEPSPRVLGNPVAGPLPGRRLERFLGGVLARTQVAVPPQQGAEDVRRLAPPQVLEPLPAHWSSPPGHIAGRSSIVSAGPTNLAAISAARSGPSTSMRKKPARCSFDSEYGPSVASGFPESQRYSREVAGSPSASPWSSSPRSDISSRTFSNSAVIASRCSSGSARFSAMKSPVGWPQGCGFAWIRMTYFTWCYSRGVEDRSPETSEPRRRNR